VSAHDAALDLMAALVLENGERWGAAAHPFQWTDARAVLDPKPSAPYHFLTRGRGGSKSSDLAGMTIAAALEQAPRGARLYGLAADRDQGRLLIDAIAGFQMRTSLLQGAFEIQSYRVVFPRKDVVLEILAADAPGAWGLRPWLTIVDELAQWPSTTGARTLWEAVTSAVAKLSDARLACLTSAGDPAHWSARVREHAIEDPLWRVHEVSGPAPWLDEQRLAEQRRRLTESSFARLFLNRWTAAEDRLVTMDDLRACVTLEGPLVPAEGRRYVVSVDLGLRRDRTVAAVTHAEPLRRPNDDVTVAGHRVVLDRMQTWQGSREQAVRLEDVEDWVAQASHSFNRAGVVIDPWQAVGIAQRLRGRGIVVREYTFTPSSVGRLASTLHLLLRDRALALPDDPELIDELAHVRLRETSPGVMRMDHDPDRHDDRAIALALGAVELLSAPAPGDVKVESYLPPAGPPVVQRGGLRLRGRHYLDIDADQSGADPRQPRRVAPPGWEQVGRP